MHDEAHTRGPRSLASDGSTASFQAVLRRRQVERGRRDTEEHTRFEVVRSASEAHAKDLQKSKDLCSIAWERVHRREAWMRMVSERVRDVCALCASRKCELITPCAHVFCKTCLQRVADACAVCGQSLRGTPPPVGRGGGFGTSWGR